MTWQRYHTVWTVLLFGWVANYTARIGLSPALTPIREEFHLSYSQAGLLATAFFYAYALMQFPAGHIGDRFGRKRVLVFGAFGWAAATFCTGLATTYAMLFAARFATGLFQGCYFSNDRPIVAAVTPREKMGLGQGVSFTGLGIGMCAGILLAGAIADAYGWRSIFLIMAIPSVAAGALSAVLLEEPSREGSQPGRRTPYRMAFQNRDLWMIYVSGIAGIYALWVLGTWAPEMLREVGVKGLSAASTYASLIGAAAVPGLILSGRASDRLLRRGIGRKAVVAAELVLLAGVMAGLGYGVEARAPVWAFAAGLFVAGFFVWGVWGPIHSLVADLTPADIRGTVYGLMNTIHFIGSLVAPWTVGWLRDRTGSFAMGAYSAAAVVAAGAVVMGAVRPSYRAGIETPMRAGTA